MIEVMSVTIKVVQILFLFFLAMMAHDIGLNLSSIDIGNLPIDIGNLPREEDIDDNSGCETQDCESKYIDKKNKKLS